MPTEHSNKFTIHFFGYTISLISMALAGWLLYDALTPTLSPSSIAALRIYQALIFALSFLVFGLAPRKKQRRCQDLAVICAGLFLVGLLSFTAALCTARQVSFAFAIAAATVLPIGRAGFLSLWIGVIGAQNQNTAGKNFVLSWIASSFFLVVVGRWFEHVAFVLALSALLALVNIVLLFACTKRLPLETDSTNKSRSNIKLFWQRAWPLTLFGGLLSFCAEIISRMTLSTTIWLALPSGLATSFCKLIAACVLIAAWKRFGGIEALSKVFPPLYFLVITCCIPLSFFGEGFLAFGGIVTSLVSAAFTILMTIACVSDSCEKQISPVPSFCLFAGLFYLGMVLGDFVGVLSNHLAGSAISVYSAISLVCIYILSIGFFLFYRFHKGEKDAKEPAEHEQQKDLRQRPSTESPEDANTQRIEALAKQYMLSNREQDVLRLLAQGRDAPFIAKKLFITENTVRSHIKKIYLKMGIHSRQELFSLVHPESPEAC